MTIFYTKTELPHIDLKRGNKNVYWHISDGGEVLFFLGEGGAKGKNGRKKNGKTVTVDDAITYSALEKAIGEYALINICTRILQEKRGEAKEDQDYYFTSALGVFTIAGKERVFSDRNVSSVDGDSYPRDPCAESRAMTNAKAVAESHGSTGRAFLKKLHLMVGKAEENGTVSTPCMSCRGKAHAAGCEPEKLDIYCHPARQPDKKPAPDLNISKATSVGEVGPNEVYKTTLGHLMPELEVTLPKIYGEGKSVADMILSGEKEVASGDKITQSLLKKAKSFRMNSDEAVLAGLSHADLVLKTLVDKAPGERLAHINQRLVSILQDEMQRDKEAADKVKHIKAIIVETKKGEFYWGTYVEGTGPARATAAEIALANAHNRKDIKAVYAMEFDRELIANAKPSSHSAKKNLMMGLSLPRELDRSSKSSVRRAGANGGEVDCELMVFPLNDGSLSVIELEHVVWRGKMKEQCPDMFAPPKRGR